MEELANNTVIWKLERSHDAVESALRRVNPLETQLTFLVKSAAANTYKAMDWSSIVAYSARDDRLLSSQAPKYERKGRNMDFAK